MTRFWKKKEEPKEEPKSSSHKRLLDCDFSEFEPCLDTLLWLHKEYDFEPFNIELKDIERIIENVFGDYCELCPVCRSNWVFEGQWCWYVPSGRMHRVYQELSNGASSIDYASEGQSDPCCETCYYEDGLSEELDNKEGSYIRHLCYVYGTWKEYGCEGDTETCVYCAEREGEEE
tara:strand:+ start:500 stop:1024 length:525 start_codon:yes stop_codon:yes gene_type:complete